MVMGNWQFIRVKFEARNSKGYEPAIIVSQFGEAEIPIMVMFKEDIENLIKEWKSGK
jgi:hypothetical protein